MTRLLLTILITLSTSLSILAQDDNWKQSKEQFKSEKIAFISTQMNFSVEEAQKFWPIYNKYDEIFDNIGERRRKNFEAKRTQGIDALSPETCEKILKKSFELDEEELNARKQFYNELSVNFDQKTIIRYYHSEHEFRRKVICNTKTTGGSFGKSFKNN